MSINYLALVAVLEFVVDRVHPKHKALVDAQIVAVKQSKEYAAAVAAATELDDSEKEPEAPAESV